MVVEEGDSALDAEFEEQSLLLFGKVNNTQYSLDFREPVSPIQALGIALTSFASKLAVI